MQPTKSDLGRQITVNEGKENHRQVTSSLCLLIISQQDRITSIRLKTFKDLSAVRLPRKSEYMKTLGALAGTQFIASPCQTDETFALRLSKRSPSARERDRLVESNR